MKFSGKMCLIIILQVTKNQGLTLSLEDKYFEKLQGGGPPPPSRFRVKCQNRKKQSEHNTRFFSDIFFKDYAYFLRNTSFQEQLPIPVSIVCIHIT